MRQTLILLACLLAVIPAFSKLPSKPEKLRQLLTETKDDTMRVSILNRLAEVFAWIDEADSTKMYSARALELAKKAGFAKGQREARLYDAFSKQSDSAALITALKPVEKEFADARALETVFAAYRNIARKQLEAGNTDLALLYLKNGESAANSHRQQIQNPELEIARLQLFQVNPYLDYGEYKVAIEIAKKALPALEKNKDSVMWARCLYNIGVGYFYLSDYNNGYKYYIAAKPLWESLHDTGMIMNCYISLSNVYFYSNHLKPDKQKVLEPLFRALELGQAAHMETSVAQVYSYIASVYFDASEPEYDRAEKYLKDAVAIYEQHEDERSRLSDIYGRLGDLYDRMKRFEDAESYFRKAIKIGEEFNDRHGVIHCRLRISRALSRKKHPDYKEALDNIKTAEASAKDVKDDELQLDVYDAYYSFYYAKKDFKNSIEYLLAYTNLKDSLFTAQNADKLQELEIQYETEKKNHEIDILKKDAEIKKNKLRRQQLLIVFISGGGILLLLIVFFVYRNISYRRTLALKNHYSKELIRNQEAERQRISKELHDNIGQHVLFLKTRIAKLGDAELLGATQETIEQVQGLSKELYPNQLERYGLVGGINSLVEKIQALTGVFVSFDVDALDRDLPAEQKINIFRIVQECLSNSLKHAKASTIRITAEIENKLCKLVVQDNGAGFDTSILEKKAHRSFGLLNLEERARILNGNFEIISAPSQGTKSIFTFPI